MKAFRLKPYSEKRSESRLYFWTPITIQEPDVCFLYRARLANYSGRGLYLTKKMFNYGYGTKVIFDEAKKKVLRNDHIELKELRKSPRKPFSKLAYFASRNRYYEGIIKNLSHRGAFIETKTKLSKADKINLVVPGPYKYIQIKCKIIHFKHDGFGVKFKSVLKIEKLPDA